MTYLCKILIEKLETTEG